MSERLQMTYMQTRMVRMAAEHWGKTLRETVDIFSLYKVLEYIEEGFGIFHMEGDEAVFDDISSYLAEKGVTVVAGTK